MTNSPTSAKIRSEGKMSEDSDDEILEKMKQAIKVMNPDCTTDSMNMFVNMLKQENDKWGEYALENSENSTFALLKKYLSFCSICEKYIIELEQKIFTRSLWADILNRYLDPARSLEQYRTVIESHYQNVATLLEELSKQTNAVTQQAETTLAILKHDEKSAKKTYEIICKDDTMAQKYMEGLKIVNGTEFSSIDEARKEALDYYKDRREKRIEFENLTNNIPKIGKLKSRLTSAMAEHKVFLQSQTRSK